MVDPLLAGAVAALVPGMLTLYWLMDRYEDLFDQARFFFALIVGLFVGIVTAFFEMNLFAFQFAWFQQQANVMQSFLWSVLGYALFETGLKAMVIGLGRFRNRPDTPFYGAPLGLAMGAMIAVQMIGFQMQVGQAAGVPFRPISFVVMAAVPVGAMLTHGAVGVWVGKGAAEGSLGRGWATGMAFQAPVLAASWLWWQALGQGGAGMGIPAVIALGYGAGLLWITRKRVLDHVVPPEIRDQVRREQRRAARAAGRAKGAGAASEGASGTAAVAGADTVGDVVAPGSEATKEAPTTGADDGDGSETTDDASSMPDGAGGPAGSGPSAGGGQGTEARATSAEDLDAASRGDEAAIRGDEAAARGRRDEDRD